jgi:hypothetical protein
MTQTNLDFKAAFKACTDLERAGFKELADEIRIALRDLQEDEIIPYQNSFMEIFDWQVFEFL